MASIIRSVWAWLTKNWEPITSVSALIVSAWSSVMAYQGIGLANRGVELAQESQNENYRAAVLARTPVFDVTVGPKSISVKNLGLGPGNIYQINISSGHEFTSKIENSDPKRASEELTTFIKTWLASLKDAPPEFRSKLTFSNVLGLYNVGQENALIRMGDGSDFPEQFFRQAKDLVLNVCFSDLAADTSGSSVTGEPETEDQISCDPARSMVNYNVQRP